NAWYSGNFRASAPRPIRAANTVPGSGETTVIGGTPDSARRTRDDDNVRLPHGTPLPGWDPPRLVGERRRGERAGLLRGVGIVGVVGVVERWLVRREGGVHGVGHRELLCFS